MTESIYKTSKEKRTKFQGNQLFKYFKNQSIDPYYQKHKKKQHL